MRLALPLVLPCLLAVPAWGLESTDLRLHFEVWEGDYDVDAAGTSTEDEFDHCFGVRLAMVQPLNVFMSGDLIAVLGVAYIDAEDELLTLTGTPLNYQTFTFRYGFGYRAELGNAFAIDAYPYVGIGWASMEFGDSASDPGLLYEAGAEIDVAVTLNDWQLGVNASYGLRHSSHTIQENEVLVDQVALAFGGFLGCRF